MSLFVRQMAPEDIAGVVALQFVVFPPPFPTELLWTAEDVAVHLEKFGAGQFVAIAEDRIIGSASATRMSESDWVRMPTWEEAVGGHRLARFDPVGSTLFGLDISVDPGWRGRGVARLLYEARYKLVRREGLERYGTACRMPDLAASGLEPDMYAREVAGGRRSDRTMTPLLRIGLCFQGLLRGFMPDPESLNCAARMEWRA